MHLCVYTREARYSNQHNIIKLNPDFIYYSHMRNPNAYPKLN